MSQPDMSQILQQAQAMQAKLQEAQREILESTVSGEAGNGLVKIEMEGTGKVTSVKIDPQVVDPEDIETLQDLLVGAFGEAHTKLSSLAQEKMGPLSQGMDGMGLF